MCPKGSLESSGEVVPMVEINTTWPKPVPAVACAKAARVALAPIQSTATGSPPFGKWQSGYLAQIGTALLAMIREPAPFIGATKESGSVTSPTKMPSLSSHFLHPKYSRALVTFLTRARTGRFLLFNWLYTKLPVLPVAPVTTTGPSLRALTETRADKSAPSAKAERQRRTMAAKEEAALHNTVSLNLSFAGQLETPEPW
mmetsp:Transcript_104539/g.280982  ORF Transcript_104539/g.280982 Transcript_104539/m.280982 type:complete len:200 (-) Transcript_104539:4-603(-)